MSLIRAVSAVSLVVVVGCGTSRDGGESEAVASAKQALVTHFNWNGGGASASSWTPESGFYIDVNDNGTTAYLSFNANSVDPTSKKCFSEVYPPKDPFFPPPPPYEYCWYTRYTYTYGWGMIPSTDFHTTKHAARLSTTVTSGSEFFFQSCTVDKDAGTFTCLPAGASGTIDMTWSSNGVASSFHSGVDHKTYGSATYKTTGRWVTSSADASGTVLGIAVTAQGSLMDTQGTTVAKDVVFDK